MFDDLVMCILCGYGFFILSLVLFPPVPDNKKYFKDFTICGMFPLCCLIMFVNFLTLIKG